MDIVERNTCVISNSEDMEPLFVLEKFPVFMISNKDTDVKDDLRLDMVFDICKSTGMIQIRKLVPPEVLYQDSHFQTSHNGIWKLHNEAFSKVINKVKPKALFEIGGGTGILEKTYNSDKVDKVKWTILEPLPDPVESSSASFIKGYFPQDFSKNYKNEVLIHSNVVEHMYKPLEFISTVADVLNEGDYMVFSQPDEGMQLRNKFTTFMNFEHNFFCSEVYMDYLLENHGFRIINKEYFGDGHSIFYTTIKDSNVVKRPIEINLYDKYKKLFLEYVEYHKKMVENWNKVIANTDRPVYLFGAHISSQYYISFGLNIDGISSILDNNTSKQGKRVSGTKFHVQSPKILTNINQPIVILPKGSYSEEIKADIINNINSGTLFLE